MVSERSDYALTVLSTRCARDECEKDRNMPSHQFVLLALINAFLNFK